MKSRKETQLPLGMSQAEHKRLETRRRLLDAVDAVEAAERACIEAIAVAKAFDRFSAAAAMAAQEAQWELLEARKQFAAHQDKVTAAAIRERRTAGLEPMVAVSERLGLSDDELKGIPTPSENALINELHKSSAKAGAAVDKALAFVKQSNKRIAKMERKKPLRKTLVSREGS